MNSRTDDRAVSEVFGAILVFGLVILVLGIVQATAVPVWNENVEFNHNQQIQSELQQLDSDILTVLSTGSSRSVPISLGVRYPTRTIFLNPPPVTGNLRTMATVGGEPAVVTLTNVTAQNSETADYLSGDIGPFQSRSTEYQPSYNQYQNAPTTVNEHTVLYNRFVNDTIMLDDGALVDGRRILVPVIAGNVSRSGSDTSTVTVKPMSTSTNAVGITNTASNRITLTLTTRLSEETWETEILAAEYDPNGNNSSRYVQNVTCLEHNQPMLPCNGDLKITFEQGATYELRMAKVSLGGGTGESVARYLTTIDGDGSSISEDGSAKLVVEVRDSYNNPVSGELVNFSSISGTASGTVSPSAKTTDSSGRAEFNYEPSTDGQATITFNISKNPDAPEKAAFTVEVVNASTSAASAYNIRWDTSTIENEEGVVDCTESSCTYDRQADSTDNILTLFANTTPTAIGASVDFSINDTSIATLGGESTETDASGEATADLETTTDGDVTVFVSSGGSSDILTITVLDSNVAPTINRFDITDRSNPGLGARIDVDWNVSDADGDLDTLNITLADSNGNIVDSVSPAVSGTSANGQSTLEDSSGYGETYTIEMTVTDAQGNVVTDSKTVTA